MIPPLDMPPALKVPQAPQAMLGSSTYTQKTVGTCHTQAVEHASCGLGSFAPTDDLFLPSFRLQVRLHANPTLFRCPMAPGHLLNAQKARSGPALPCQAGGSSIKFSSTSGPGAMAERRNGICCSHSPVLRQFPGSGFVLGHTK